MGDQAKRIGDYRILRVIGRGGMGSVHLAVHEPSGETVALKVLSQALATDAATMRRFELEQEALTRVEHPGVVRSLSGIQHADGHTFFAMEYLDGHTLEQVLRAEAPLSAARAAGLARRMFAALAAAHDVGIVHRDVKPSNIVVLGDPPDETVKVLDFGLARLADATRLTTTGQVMGTLHYMSPEQCEGARALDARSDVYSGAAVVFEMLTGRPPFVADTPVSLLRSHVVTPAPDLGEIRDDVSPELVRLVADCLSKRPQARPPGARAVLERLEALPAAGDTLRLRREAETVAAFPPRSSTDADARRVAVAADATPKQPHRRSPWPVVAVAALVLAVALAFALGREKGRDDDEPALEAVAVGAAAAVGRLEAALRTSDHSAFREVVSAALAERSGDATRFSRALAAVDSADFKRGFVVGDVERGRMRMVIKGAALPAALGIPPAQSLHGIRIEVERAEDRWVISSATPATERAGDVDKARASADNAVLRALRPPQLKRTLEMAGLERTAAGRRDAARRLLRELRSGETTLTGIDYRLDAEQFDTTNGTWRVEVRLPELAAALDLPGSRLELTLALAARRRGGKTEFRVEAARLLRD